eukprot:EG_transcript_5158
MCLARRGSTVALRDLALQAAGSRRPIGEPKRRLPPGICVGEDMSREDAEEFFGEDLEGLAGQRPQCLAINSPTSGSSLCLSHGLSDTASLTSSFVSGIGPPPGEEDPNGSFALAVSDWDPGPDAAAGPPPSPLDGAEGIAAQPPFAAEEEEEWVIVANDDCGPNADAAPGGRDRWVRGALSPADVAANVMGLIHRHAKRPSPASAQFEAYCQELFDRLKDVTPWDPGSLLSPLHPMPTSSRSGSWLFQTDDEYLVLKRVRAYEKDKLLRMAEDYVAHQLGPAPSLLCPVYGCYRYLHRGTNLYFVLKGVCYPPGASLQALYDLKGSTAGRTASPRHGGFLPVRPPVGPALKDNDLRQPIPLRSAATWAALQAMLERDSEFLARHDVFDYSLLVAEVEEPASPVGAKDSPHSVCPASVAGVAGGPDDRGGCPQKDLHRPSLAGVSSLLKVVLLRLHPQPSAPRGPHRPWPCAGQRVVYLGIIDFMTPWSVVNIGDGEGIPIPKGRSLEYFVMKRVKPGCSIMPPPQYQLRFVEQVMRKFAAPETEAPPAGSGPGGASATPPQEKLTPTTFGHCGPCTLAGADRRCSGGCPLCGDGEAAGPLSVTVDPR